jgi:hypothetical protein
MTLVKYKNYNFTFLFKENLLAFSLLFLGIFHVFLEIKFGTNSFGDLRDGRFNNFTLEHFYRALIGEEQSFKNANFFYPAPNVIMLSDNHWFLGFIYAFFRNLGFNSSKSFNFWIFCGFFANFISAYYVLRKFNFSANSSAIGAYLFTFNQIILLKIGHMQLNFKAFIPLTLLYSKQYFETLDFKYISYIILCIILQLLCSSYNGNFLALFVFIFFVIYLSKFKKDDFHKIFPQKFSLKISIPILVLGIFVLTIYALPYFETMNIYNIRGPLTNEENFSLISLLTLSNSSLWNFITNYFSLKSLENYKENQFFFGIGLWLATLSLIFNKNISKNLQYFDKILIKSILLTLLFFWLDQYINTFGFLQISIPSFSLLRASTRFFYVIFFAIVYLATFSLNHLEKTNKKKLLYILTTIILAESLVSFIPNSNFSEEENTIQEYKNLILQHGNKDSVFFFVVNNKNRPTSYVQNEISIMIASRDLGAKTINGYSGQIPLYKKNYTNNCQEISKIIEYNEDVISNVLKKDFKYDRKNLLVFFGKELCTNQF